ncbi:MAG TPA: hypothetical protein VIL36_09450, partial [Acidimicrobiales bacterium]
MPSKRQPSKQQRAAQNRARREALAARRANAQQSRSGETRAVTNGSSADSGGGRRRGLLGGLLAPPASSASGGGAQSRAVPAANPNAGRGALLVALVLSVGAAIAIIFLIKPKLDDRDEVVPTTGFGGLYLEAREALGGSSETTETTFLDAQGPVGLVIALLPAAVAVGAFLVYRARQAREASTYWPLTIGMVLMALTVMLGNVWAMPAMVAMAIASFQVRRQELPAKIAERAAARDARRGGDDEDVIDVEEVDADEAYDEDEYDDAYDDDAYDDDEDEDEDGDGGDTEVDTEVDE